MSQYQNGAAFHRLPPARRAQFYVPVHAAVFFRLRLCLNEGEQLPQHRLTPHRCVHICCGIDALSQFWECIQIPHLHFVCVFNDEIHHVARHEQNTVFGSNNDISGQAQCLSNAAGTVEVCNLAVTNGVWGPRRGNTPVRRFSASVRYPARRPTRPRPPFVRSMNGQVVRFPPTNVPLKILSYKSHTTTSPSHRLSMTHWLQSPFQPLPRAVSKARRRTSGRCGIKQQVTARPYSFLSSCARAYFLGTGTDIR